MSKNKFTSNFKEISKNGNFTTFIHTLTGITFTDLDIRFKELLKLEKDIYKSNKNKDKEDLDQKNLDDEAKLQLDIEKEEQEKASQLLKEELDKGF